MARPKAALVVTDGATADARLDGASGADRAATGPTRADRADVRDGTGQHDGRQEAADVEADGGPVASAIHRQGRRRLAGRTAAWHAAEDRGHAGGSDRDADAGKYAARRDALEHAHAREGDGRESDERPSHLAGLRPAAASHEDVQTVARSAADRQGPRHRRAVSQPAAACGGVLCRRKAADPGVGSDGAACCRCARAKRNGARTTTNGTGRRRSSRRWK